MSMAAMATAAAQLPRLSCCAATASKTNASSSSSSSSSCCVSSPSSSSMFPALRVRVVSGGRAEGRLRSAGVARAVATEDSVEEEGIESATGLENLGISPKEVRLYPQGLQKYETMAVLRPDITEDQRLALTQRYEEAIIAGGGLDVEMFNRGMQPLAYNIKVKNMGGVSSRYLDGLYLLFTYVTAPKAQLALQQRLNADDDVIRSTTFRLKA